MSDSKLHSMSEARANVAAGKVTQPDVLRYIVEYVNGELNKAELGTAFRAAKSNRSRDAILKYMSDWYLKAVATQADRIMSFNRDLGEAIGTGGKEAMVELDPPPMDPTAAEKTLYEGYASGAAPFTPGKANKLGTALKHAIRNDSVAVLRDLLEVSEMANKSGAQGLPSASVAQKDLVDFFDTQYGTAYTGRMNADGRMEYTATGRDLHGDLVFLDGPEEGVIPNGTASRLLGLYFDHNGLKQPENGAMINVDARMSNHLGAGLQQARTNVLADLKKKGLYDEERDEFVPEYSDDELKAKGFDGAALTSVKNSLEMARSDGGLIRFSDVKTVISEYMPTQENLTDAEIAKITSVYPDRSPRSSVGQMINAINATADAIRLKKKQEEEARRARSRR